MEEIFTDTPPLKTFIRHEITPPNQVAINKNVLRVSRLAKPVQIAFAAKFLLETKILIDKVNALRKERGYQALSDDPAFMFSWNLIEAAGRANDALEVLRNAMPENMRLTYEVNCHLWALGRPKIKVFQA